MSVSGKLTALTFGVLVGTLAPLSPHATLVPQVASPAMAVSIGTKWACRADYKSYCGTFKVGSSDLRKCMNDNGERLSKKCIDALISEGEISKEEVARRAAGQ